MIERTIDEIESILGDLPNLSQEQRDAIKMSVANYAFAACIDSAIRGEVESVLGIAEKN